MFISAAEKRQVICCDKVGSAAVPQSYRVFDHTQKEMSDPLARVGRERHVWPQQNVDLRSSKANRYIMHDLSLGK
jgi:hypothetical protein